MEAERIGMYPVTDVQILSSCIKLQYGPKKLLHVHVHVVLFYDFMEIFTEFLMKMLNLFTIFNENFY